jgi:predicted amidohydrolase YtcJ
LVSGSLHNHSHSDADHDAEHKDSKPNRGILIHQPNVLKDKVKKAKANGYRVEVHGMLYAMERLL